MQVSATQLRITNGTRGHEELNSMTYPMAITFKNKQKGHY